MDISMYIILIIVIFLVLILASAIKIMAEYQRIVVFRLGRLIGIKGPGLVLIIPIIDSFIKLDLISIISLEFGIPFLGTWSPLFKQILSGAIIGLGAEPVHNLITALENRRKSRFQKRELEQALSKYN